MSLQFLVCSNPLQRVHNRLKPVTTNIRGFTLMEMLIVIAIMLLLVIATLPRIKQTLEDSKVRESSRQLNSYIAMAKSRAAATGRPCGIYLVSEKIGDPTAYPGIYQSSQLFLAEVPPPYSGDVLESRVVVTNLAVNQTATTVNGPPWLLNFIPAAAGLTTLVAPGEPFLIRFDHKGPIFNGLRGDPARPAPLNNPNLFFIVGGPTLPPTANGLYHATNNPYAGYQYEIARAPRRIGAPLNLPRGTAIDLMYSGFGNDGVNFATCGTPVGTPPGYVLVMFAPSGAVANVVYQVYDNSNANQSSPIFPFRAVDSAAPGAVHFLVGRPEKVQNAVYNVPPQLLSDNNLVDANALWVSVGRMTGSVTTTENAFTIDPALLPATPTFFDYVIRAREYAITQDVKGGQ
ncbi:MAG: Tfp pilus assembly protein FimT/FimU [Pirellulaceae bacterium]